MSKKPIAYKAEMRRLREGWDDWQRQCLEAEARVAELEAALRELTEAANDAIAELGPVLGIGQFPRFGRLVEVRNLRSSPTTPQVEE